MEEIQTKMTKAPKVEAIISESAAPEEKHEVLKEYLSGLGSLAVAFSGGVDSTFLLKTAHEVLGDRVIAITAKSCSFPGRELEEAVSFCEKEKIRQIIMESHELDLEGFRRNAPDRCYICKKALFGKMIDLAEKNGMDFLAEGSNMDDNGDYRPGLTAVAELQVKSPLRVCALYKEEIRAMSQKMDLPTWRKPSFACLASRFPYGEEITEEKLGMVEQAEGMLMEYGFEQFRVRIHGNLARIEIRPQEFEKLLQPEVRTRIYSAFRKFGFSYISMDLLGYRTGSMNENLKD